MGMREKQKKLVNYIQRAENYALTLEISFLAMPMLTDLKTV